MTTMSIKDEYDQSCCELLLEVVHVHSLMNFNSINLSLQSRYNQTQFNTNFTLQQLLTIRECEINGVNIDEDLRSIVASMDQEHGCSALFVLTTFAHFHYYNTMRTHFTFQMYKVRNGDAYDLYINLTQEPMPIIINYGNPLFNRDLFNVPQNENYHRIIFDYLVTPNSGDESEDLEINRQFMRHMFNDMTEIIRSFNDNSRVKVAQHNYESSDDDNDNQ